MGDHKGEQNGNDEEDDDREREKMEKINDFDIDDDLNGEFEIAEINDTNNSADKDRISQEKLQELKNITMKKNKTSFPTAKTSSSKEPPFL